MAIIATGSKTIIDLSDGKSLSVYLGSNQPRTQIKDVNVNSFQPNWTTTAGKLVITPVVYANQTAIALTNRALTITWKRKEGSGTETALASGETVSGNVLSVNQNKLSSVSSGLLTYIAYVTYTDPDTTVPINAMTDITFALVTTGQNAKSAWISGDQVFKYDAAGAVTPAQITLTANLQNVTMGKWQYRNAAGAWAATTPASPVHRLSSNPLMRSGTEQPLPSASPRRIPTSVIPPASTRYRTVPRAQQVLLVERVPPVKTLRLFS